MSFGDLLTNLLTTQREKAIKVALSKLPNNQNPNNVEVKPEDYVLTDKEFEDFLNKNKYLIGETDGKR